jgi:hypothetical protein
MLMQQAQHVYLWRCSIDVVPGWRLCAAQTYAAGSIVTSCCSPNQKPAMPHCCDHVLQASGNQQAVSDTLEVEGTVLAHLVNNDAAPKMCTVTVI